MPEIYEPAEDSYFLSEILTEEISKSARKNQDLTFLEIGAGSGIQLERALNSGIKKKNIFSCDANSKAVRKCKELGFNCIQSDLFENIDGKFDIIVFNPPYLPEDKREDEDSKLATTGGKKGSEIINRFLKQAKPRLKKQGRIFLLASSLTKGINFKPYKKKLLGKKKMFFEEIYVWEISR